MTTPSRRAGLRCLRRFIVPAVLAAFAAAPAAAQENPKSEEWQRLEDYRNGRIPIGPEAKPLFDKVAKFFVAELTASSTARPGAEHGYSWVVTSLDKRLHLPAQNSPFAASFYGKLGAEQKAYLNEFGKSVIEALDSPTTKSGNPAVRMNGARMAAEIARSGYDGAANLLKVLAKQDESDAVKFWALRGLHDLFLIVPDPNIPEKTVFQKDNTGNVAPLEAKAVVALTDFVFRKPPEDTTAEDVDAMFYVRREAIRALANVRVLTVRQAGNPVTRPALTLLKVARGDGVNPASVTPQGPDPRAVGERIEAVIGFCQLFPDRYRDLNVDYGVYHVGRALADIAAAYQPGSTATSTPWKVSAQRLRDTLATWHARAVDTKQPNAQLIKDLLDTTDRDILTPIEQNQQGVLPNPTTVGQWLQQNLPKSKSLFTNDAKTTIDVQ